MGTNLFADLYTAEGEKLSGQPWQSYPRPQLRREEDSWLNLNGQWEFAVTASKEVSPEYEETIQVPFPPEALLSGIHRAMPRGAYLWYRREFVCPECFSDGRVLLHIGAADQVAIVWVNGVLLGEHVGGYDSFSYEITHLLKEKNWIVVQVTDLPQKDVLPYGKQREKRGGMWYTPVSGIWQTVWLERVPEHYIRALHIKNGEDWAEIRVDGDCTEGELKVRTPLGEWCCAMKNGQVRVQLEQPEHWSPEHPYCYEFTLQAGEDVVQSYFALRTLTIQNADGIPRLCLNGKPYFFHGVLDQGYWSDGLFTPAHPVCYEQDILAMKQLGFNTLRKHIKVEPQQFYYDCDRLGMVVFQDMVNNGDYNFIRDTALPTVGLKRRRDASMHRDAETREQFLHAMEKTVEQLENHPCVCYWTIFNEGWGQFESTQCYHRLKKLDNTRFIATVSGWFKGGESDVEAEHVYFKPFKPKFGDKPLVLSEFGGYSYTPAGHAFHPGKEYGYRHFNRQEDLEQALAELYRKEILPAVEKGLCGSIYTQLSDVEDETNGLLSYDRKVRKVRAKVMQRIAPKL